MNKAATLGAVVGFVAGFATLWGLYASARPSIVRAVGDNVRQSVRDALTRTPELQALAAVAVEPLAAALQKALNENLP